MKAKTTQSVQFLEDLCNHVVRHPRLRKDTTNRNEREVQTELREFIIDFLLKYFQGKGYKDSEAKANQSFYWEGEEGSFGRMREPIFGARNYPDFIIEKPYKIAIEYKQNKSGSVVKHGIGQSIMHTLSGDFDFVIFLFKDQNKDDKVASSATNQKENTIIRSVWDNYNVMVRLIHFDNVK